MRRFMVMSAMFLLLAPLGAAFAKANEQRDFRLADIDDPLRSTFTGDPAGLGKPQIQQAIAFAAAAKNWQILKESDGRAELTSTVNGKHLMHVQIIYDNAGYDIVYLDSANLLFAETREFKRTSRVIHKNYNRWIRELATAINNKVGEPAQVMVATTPLIAKTRPAPQKLVHAHPVPPDTGFAAITDVDALPLRAAGKDRYQHYLTLPAPKAFVVTEKGGWRFWYKSDDVMAKALDYCEQQGIGCWLYAVDDRVVWNADPAKRLSRFEQLVKPGS